MTENLGDRLLRVALRGVVPDDDQHVIADAQAEIERLSAALAEAMKLSKPFARFADALDIHRSEVPDTLPIGTAPRVADLRALRDWLVKQDAEP